MTVYLIVKQLVPRILINVNGVQETLEFLTKVALMNSTQNILPL